jgi:hypothetical protein
MNDRKQPWYREILASMCLIFTCLTQSSFGLVVSEIMYHPAGEDETLEFIELYNDRAVSEDLSGYAFVDGIQYVFPENTEIESRGYVVVARDPNALAAQYGLSGVLGPYTGSLSNSSDRIDLANANGGIFMSFRYSRQCALACVV